jgi:protein-tyrosine phosphatase
MTDLSGNRLPPPRDPQGPYRVCLVCLGNICRSPMAEVVLRAQLAAEGLAGKVVVDSAGTGAWHAGEPMSSPARAALARRGYDGAAHRARQFSLDWLPGLDLVVAMDASNLTTLRPFFRGNTARTGSPEPERLELFGDVADLRGADVPDPYGGSAQDYDEVLTMLERGMPPLVAQLAGLVG